MKTVIYHLPNPQDETELRHAADILRTGGLVAFPTETVYGVGAAITFPDAIRRIFEVKGRPNDNPLIVHIPEPEQLKDLAEDIPSVAWTLADRFWPGPLTLVLKRKGVVPDEVTAGLSTVAVRIPGHPVALKLLQLAGLPVAAPSANLSGRPSPTLGKDVAEDLNGKIDVIIDAGPAGIGLESTVLDLTGPQPRVLRPGGVTREMLEEVFGPGGVEAPWRVEADKPSAPGMKYRHYAPKAPLKVFSGFRKQVEDVIRLKVQENVSAGHRVAVLGFDGNEQAFPGAEFLSLGCWDRPEEAAQRLFRLLRECDRRGVNVIFGECPPKTGVGLAVMNRLWKAAGGDVIEL